MISILTEPLPDCIEADGQKLPVLTDFRDWLRFLLLLSSDLPDHEKAAMLPLWLREPVPLTPAIVRGLTTFCEASALDPDPPETDADDPPPMRPPTWDWTIDGKFVLGDFRRYYHIDLLRPDSLHWWEFKALFLALPTESRSMERIGIRGTDLSKIQGKERKKHIAELQRRIALPFRVDADAIGDVFASMI